ncbi:YjbH domain-containing protein [Yoonia sp. SS1-5]|uniref:YjbH domain-containing protein n=1 Tax=Yoonia rhodophyticola TaxID=3137370 RepID=A0ABZ3JBF4_9RHOB
MAKIRSPHVKVGGNMDHGGQRRCNGRWYVATALAVLTSGFAQAQDYTYSLYGLPGLIDMPTAQSAEDAELALTFGHFGGSTRTTLSFQMTPRLMGSFRYSRIDNFLRPRGGDETFDRSFDLRYRFVDEGRYRPAVAVGLQDFVGTGIYSGEYIVATKEVVPSVQVTGGIGWGRLGSYQSFANPLGALDESLETRPSGFAGSGGQLERARWFRGDAALFGGVAWQANDRLTFKAEYSSDTYLRENDAGRDLFDRASPWNVGLSYALSDAAVAQAYYLYGTEAGVAVTFDINPKTPIVDGGTGQRPSPVAPRAPGAAADLSWRAQADAPDILRESMERLLKLEGMQLEAIEINPTATTVLIRNTTYIAPAEAVGRTARILTRVMPASVEQFTIVPMEGGLRTAAISLRRSDIEALEFAPDNSRQIYNRARIADASQIGTNATPIAGVYPRFNWRLGPYVRATYFDPDNPVQFDVGAELSATYSAAPGLTFTGRLRQPLFFNRTDEPRPSNSVIERVRSNAQLYVREGDPAISRLTAAYQFNLAPDYYGRVTAGYLETMFGGVSTEILWKPVQSRLGLGLELNYARQRAFDQLFDFRDYEVVTGHASAYYAFDNNWHGQIDVGRYLAGDYGATFALDREFDNGWRVGAYATLTDVPFEDFGEGSFDKGLRLSVPLGHFVGTPSRKVYSASIRPLVRDGGARLNVDWRLYETVRQNHDDNLVGSWGRFWR